MKIVCGRGKIDNVGCVDNLDDETKYRISPFNIDRSLTNILTYILWSDILFLQTLFYNLSVMANKIKISILKYIFHTKTLSFIEN